MSADLDRLAYFFWKNGPRLESAQLGDQVVAVADAMSAGMVRQNGESFEFANSQVLMDGAIRHFATSVLRPLLHLPKDLFGAMREDYFDLVRSNRMQEGGDFRGLTLAFLAGMPEAVDVMALGMDALRSGADRHDVTDALSKAMPYLITLNIDSLMALPSPAAAVPGGEAASWLLSSALSGRLRSHAHEALDIVRRHLAVPREHSAGFFRVAMVRVVESAPETQAPELVNLATGGVEHVMQPAMDVIGFVTWKDASDEAFALALDCALTSAKTPSSPLFERAAQALTGIVRQRPELNPHLADLARTGAPSATEAVSQFLMSEQRHHGHQAWFEDLVFLCVPAAHTNAVGCMDVTLTPWVASGRDDKVLAWLDRWIGTQDLERIKEWEGGGDMGATFREILNRPVSLSKLVTHWLIREDLRYPLMVDQLLQLAEIGKLRNVAFHKALVDTMDPLDMLLLVRRTLGYVTGEYLLRSMFWSLTETEQAEKRAFGFVLQAFVRQMGYDFPAGTRKFLAEKRDAEGASQQIKDLCTQILQEMDSYFGAIGALPRLKELAPSHQKSMQFAVARWKQSGKYREEAEAKSVFASIAMKISLKGGQSSFSFFEGKYGERMFLKKLSSEFAMPRSATLNIVGAQFKRSEFRTCQRGD